MYKIESLFLPDGHLNDEGVALYVDGLKLRLQTQLPAEVLVHVASCTECKAEVTELFGLMADRDYADLTSHPFFALDRNQTAWRVTSPLFRIAASIVVLLGIGGGAYWLATRSPVPAQPVKASLPTSQARTDSSMSRQSGQSTQHSAKSTTPDVAFAESPQLEDLVNSTFRSGETEVTSPVNGSRVEGNVVFTWQSDAAPPYGLAILDHRGAVIHSTKVRASRYLLQDTLAPGRYYWKLVGGGQLLFVGTFEVRSGR